MPDTTTPIAPEEARTFSEVDRARETRAQREAENDARMERSIRIAMGAKEDSAGCCFYCGKKLDVEELEPVDGILRTINLHPMPYLDCPGPSTGKIAPSGRIEPKLSALPVMAKQALPDLKPVVRPFGERD